MTGLPAEKCMPGPGLLKSAKCACAEELIVTPTTKRNAIRFISGLLVATTGTRKGTNGAQGCMEPVRASMIGSTVRFQIGLPGAASLRTGRVSAATCDNFRDLSDKSTRDRF